MEPILEARVCIKQRLEDALSRTQERHGYAYGSIEANPVALMDILEMLGPMVLDYINAPTKLTEFCLMLSTVRSARALDTGVEMSIELFRDIEAAINDYANDPRLVHSDEIYVDARKVLAAAARMKAHSPEFQHFFPEEGVTSSSLQVH